MPVLIAQTVIPISLFKPVVFAVLFFTWARLIGALDRDMDYVSAPRRAWNALQLAAGMVGFGLWLVIPWFWMGLCVVLICVGGAMGGYAFYRNAQVPPEIRWTLSWDWFTRVWNLATRIRSGQRAATTLLDADNQALPRPLGDSLEAKAHQLLEDLLGYSVVRNAQFIHIAASDQRAAISVQVDGVRYPQPPVTPTTAVSLIDYLKKKAALDVFDRRRRLWGQLGLDIDNCGRYRLFLATSGSRRGLIMTIEIEPEIRVWPTFEELGLLPGQQKRLLPTLDDNNGIVIVASPPHHGQTTTLYSFLRRKDPYTTSIATLEQRITMEIEGLRQNTVPLGSESGEWKRQTKSLLRQDYQVLMLDRLADTPLAIELADMAHELRIYVGLPQADTFTALRAWGNAIGDPTKAADSLAAIIAPRLVRRLCTTCRIAYRPDPDVLRKLNLPTNTDTRLYKHSGFTASRRKNPCPDCHGIGYRGCTGVFEVMILDDQARQLIITNQLAQLRTHLRKQKMQWLQEVAMEKVVDGTTSISEITRVLGASPDNQEPDQKQKYTTVSNKMNSDSTLPNV